MALGSWLKGIWFKNSEQDSVLEVLDSDFPNTPMAHSPTTRTVANVLDDLVVSDYVTVTLSNDFCNYMMSQASGHRKFDASDMKRGVIKGVVLAVKQEDRGLGPVLEVMSVKRTMNGSRGLTYTVFSNEIEAIKVCDVL